MSSDYGNGLSRILTSLDTEFSRVVFQADKPPLDSEWVTLQDLHKESQRKLVQSQISSGFITDVTTTLQDYETNPLWSNFLKLGTKSGAEQRPVIWANVNGWMLPVIGSDTFDPSDTGNVIKLNPPPSTDSRIDLVFLEVWESVVSPNPSTANKPSASTFYRFGNTLYGGTNITDDILDPEQGVETSKRTQVQYRIRVHDGNVALDVYPDGLEDPNVLGRGAAATPVAGLTFSNMREELGDASLWRAGNGDPTNGLGSVDGYVYAIPICAVFRRNTQSFVAKTMQGTPHTTEPLTVTPLPSRHPMQKC
jgi:hypothetical protein